MKIKVWDALNSEESDADEVEVDSPHLVDDAVEKLAEESNREEYWERAQYCARMPDGELRLFDVYAESTIVLHTSERKSPCLSG